MPHDARDASAVLDQKLRTGRVHINVSMPPLYARRLKQESAERGLTISELLRRAVDALFGDVLPPREDDNRAGSES